METLVHCTSVKLPKPHLTSIIESKQGFGDFNKSFCFPYLAPCRPPAVSRKGDSHADSSRPLLKTPRSQLPIECHATKQSFAMSRHAHCYSTSDLEFVDHAPMFPGRTKTALTAQTAENCINSAVLSGAGLLDISVRSAVQHRKCCPVPRTHALMSCARCHSTLLSTILCNGQYRTAAAGTP